MVASCCRQKKVANDDATTSMIVAGNGLCGPASNMLCNPIGIFVDIDLNMYIADSGNNRVQFCTAGQLSGTTVAGSKAAVSFALMNLTDVMLDASGYLFILDNGKGRIVQSAAGGFRYVVACSGTPGARSDQLMNPWTFTFDSHCNIYVADQNNYRIQNFSMIDNSCGESES
jgi:hypothetical protein